MKLIVGTLLIAVAIGYLSGGRLSNLTKLHIRWAPLAVVGLAMQVVSPPGRWPLAMLFGSFVVLTILVAANRRIVGFWLILVGVALNFTVIALNSGMPVSAQALTASGQQNMVSELTDNDDSHVKHHLVTGEDRLLFLGDVIAIASPVAQVISLGDIFVYGGVAVVMIVGMRYRANQEPVSTVRDVQGTDA